MESIFLIGLLAATLRVATPLILGTLGELFSERSGVLNLGIEGTMFLGAFVGFVGAKLTGSLWLGFGMAIAGRRGRRSRHVSLDGALRSEPACVRLGTHAAVDRGFVVRVSPDLRRAVGPALHRYFPDHIAAEWSPIPGPDLRTACADLCRLCLDPGGVVGDPSNPFWSEDTRGRRRIPKRPMRPA